MSAWSLAGRWRRCPVGVRSRSTASVSAVASGMPTINDQVPFRAWLAAIGGFGPTAPPPVSRDARSRLARAQSIRSASPRRSKRVRSKRVRWSGPRPRPPDRRVASRSRPSHNPFPGQVLLGDAGFQHEADAGQAGAIGDTGSATLGPRGLGGSSGATIDHSSSGTRSLLIALGRPPVTGFERHSWSRRRIGGIGFVGKQGRLRSPGITQDPGLVERFFLAAPGGRVGVNHSFRRDHHCPRS